MVRLRERQDRMDGSFGGALIKMNGGKKVFRRGWNSSGMWIAIRNPATVRGPLMTLPYIYISTIQGNLVPWTASHMDMLSMDWEIVGAVG